MTRTRKALACTLVAVSVLGSATLTRRMLLVSAVFPPQATLSQKLHLLVATRYEIAVPHQSAFRRIRFAFIPSAQAQGCPKPTCDSSTVQATCNSCPYGMCGNCPDCQNGPCTIYTCALTTTATRLCIQQYSKATGCMTCRLDIGSTNCTKPATP